MKKNAFTLIELLVVVAIISILAALAVPAYTKIMERSRALSDANNLKQLGLGIVGYTNDNNDTIFSSGPTASAWPLLLNGTSGTKYVPVWKVFQSPFDTKRAASEVGATSPGSPISYDINKYLMGTSTGDIASPSNCILMSVLMSNPAIPTFSLTAASAATSFGTLDIGSNKANNKTVGVFSGGVYMNVLFADSHVAMMRASDFGQPLAGTSGTINDLRWNKP